MQVDGLRASEDQGAPMRLQGFQGVEQYTPRRDVLG